MTPQQILNNTFKLSSFRQGQEEVISILLSNRSALAVFPTGGGKSLCYQLPALLFEGITLVVSPLIALMKDQVDSLQKLGIKAERLDSSLSHDQVQNIYTSIQNKTLKILYISPERLKNERFMSQLMNVRISLLAIDEAHCISEWGHNFRPDYLTLTNLVKKLKVERVLALTATATPSVASDIRKQFQIRDEDHIQTSFARPNLNLSIIPSDEEKRFETLCSCLKKLPPKSSAVVYVTLQETAEEVSTLLNENGFRSSFYHAGMPDEDRVKIQNEFMSSKTPIVVATIAFGMGIDKNDIRGVFHYNLPKSIENYVQEIGRAGRDGKPSNCELIVVPTDLRTLENFTYGDTPTKESIASLVEYISSQDNLFDVNQYALTHKFDMRPLVLSTALTYLELEGAISAHSTFYTEYKIKLISSLDDIYALFNEERTEFLKKIFNSAKKGKSYYHLDMIAIEATINEPRERVIKAFEYLEGKGHLVVEASSFRQKYRNNKTLSEESKKQNMIETLSNLFFLREKRDVERLYSVITYANTSKCYSHQLIEYFGEKNAKSCNTCNFCVDGKISPVSLPESLKLSEKQIQIIELAKEEYAEELKHDRQLARLLVGLTSPLISKSGMKFHPLFGSLKDTGFKQILSYLNQ